MKIKLLVQRKFKKALSAIQNTAMRELFLPSYSLPYLHKWAICQWWRRFPEAVDKALKAAIKDQSWSADGNPHHVPTPRKCSGVFKQPDGKTHYEIWPGS